ncbi:MAG: C-terminal binding protein [Anaerolineae bacterium]|nr:C-terminal binding protein [Chloroflexota bacterium]
MPTVVLADRFRLWGDSIEQEVCRQHGVEFRIENCRTDDEIIERCGNADGIITAYADLNRHVIENLKETKVLVRYGIGYDNIDVQAATDCGIFVCNIPDYCIPEVASHAMAFILALYRKVMVYDRSIRAGTWSTHTGYPIHRLSTQTLGILGFGNIGQEVAKYAQVMGFKVIAHDPFLPDQVFESSQVKRVDSDTLFAESDIITIHVPLFKETRHLINAQAFAKMKDGVMIVNTARGGLIDTADLISAMKSGKVLAAGLDVLEEEPLTDPTAEILQLENLVLTPHAGANTVEAYGELQRRVADTACRVVKGEMVYNIVNKQLLNG